MRLRCETHLEAPLPRRMDWREGQTTLGRTVRGWGELLQRCLLGTLRQVASA